MKTLLVTAVAILTAHQALANVAEGSHLVCNDPAHPGAVAVSVVFGKDVENESYIFGHHGLQKALISVNAPGLSVEDEAVEFASMAGSTRCGHVYSSHAELPGAGFGYEKRSADGCGFNGTYYTLTVDQPNGPAKFYNLACKFE